MRHCNVVGCSETDNLRSAATTLWCVLTPMAGIACDWVNRGNPVIVSTTRLEGCSSCRVHAGETHAWWHRVTCYADWARQTHRADEPQVRRVIRSRVGKSPLPTVRKYRRTWRPLTLAALRTRNTARDLGWLDPASACGPRSFLQPIDPKREDPALRPPRPSPAGLHHRHAELESWSRPARVCWRRRRPPVQAPSS